MTFISYAQNFEDVILWRALKHVENGFYIDIGAQDPDLDSVSKGFYEHGWRGVHVEPTPAYAEKLRRARDDEAVIEAAIGAGDDRITFYEIPETGLSTGDIAIAEMHRSSNLEVVERRIEQMRLSALLDRIGDREIHWLKVDVEGMEKDVIDSWSPSSSRPWVVVVESTKPRSSEVNFADWEPTLLGLGYEFVYFDGLNRFYVHETQAALKGSFGPGPNLFDNFLLSGSSSPITMLFDERLRHRDADLNAARIQISDLAARLADFDAIVAGRDAQIHDLNDQISGLEARLKGWRAAAEAVERELAVLHASSFWRITAPLRRTTRLIRSLTNRS